MYKGYLTDIKGIKVGHYNDYENLTGTTVILMEAGFTAGVDVRGSGPGTRETDIFSAEKTVDKIHGLVLTGGSAFGLNTAGGVMGYLEKRDIGFDVEVAKVPIVPAAVIFDLGIGNPKKRPDYKSGYKAAKLASEGEARQGNIGAGIGATIGKALGMENAMKGGLGSATVQVGDLKVSALIIVNAIGDIYNLEGQQIGGIYNRENKQILNTVDVFKEGFENSSPVENTTIGVIATNAKLTKPMCNKVSQIGHNGLAKVIKPVHTSLDGDTLFTVASGEVEANLDLVSIMADEAVSKAVINAIKAAEKLEKILAYRDVFGDR